MHSACSADGAHVMPPRSPSGVRQVQLPCVGMVSRPRCARVRICYQPGKLLLLLAKAELSAPVAVLSFTLRLLTTPVTGPEVTGQRTAWVVDRYFPLGLCNPIAASYPVYSPAAHLVTFVGHRQAMLQASRALHLSSPQSHTSVCEAAGCSPDLIR